MLAQGVPQGCERRCVVGVVQERGQGLRLGLPHAPADPPGVTHPQRGHRRAEDERLDQREPGRIEPRTGTRTGVARPGSTGSGGGSSGGCGGGSGAGASPPGTAPVPAPVRAGGAGSRVSRMSRAGRTIRPRPASGRLASARPGCVAFTAPGVRIGVAMADAGLATAEIVVVELVVVGIQICLITVVGIATAVRGCLIIMIASVGRAAALGVGRADNQADDLIHRSGGDDPFKTRGVFDEQTGIVDQQHPPGIALRHAQIPHECPLNVGEPLDHHDLRIASTEIDFDDRRRGSTQGRLGHDQLSSSAE